MILTIDFQQVIFGIYCEAKEGRGVKGDPEEEDWDVSGHWTIRSVLCCLDKSVGPKKQPILKAVLNLFSYDEYAMICVELIYQERCLLYRS